MGNGHRPMIFSYSLFKRMHAHDSPSTIGGIFVTTEETEMNKRRIHTPSPIAIPFLIVGFGFFSGTAVCGTPGNFPGKGRLEDWKRAESLNEQGTKLCDKGQTDEAISKTKQAIAIYPYETLYHYNLGVYLADKKQFKASIPALLKAVDCDPRNANAYYNLGNSFAEVGDLKSSESSYRKALAIQPNDYDVLINLSLTLRAERHFDEANRILFQASKLPNANKKEIQTALKKIEALQTVKKVN